MSPCLILFTIFVILTLKTTTCTHVHPNRNFHMSHRREWRSPMEIDVRSMHRYCAGHCYYLPPNCKENITCTNIVSMQKYKPDCDASTEDPALRELCERPGNLYLISILRALSVDITKAFHAYRMHMYKTFENGHSSRCAISPFVAIAFSNDTNESVTPTNSTAEELGDVFYTCAEGDPYVSAWIKSATPIKRQSSSYSCFHDVPELKDEQQSVQLLDTSPYPPMGPGVVWSKIVSRHAQYAMGCKFIVSDNPLDTQLKLNGSGYILLPSPIFRSKHIKIAQGFAYKKDGIVEDIIFSNVNSKAKIIANLEDGAAITALEGIQDWNDEKMAYPVPLERQAIEDVKNRIAEQEIDKFYDLCNGGRALCFSRKDEEECVLNHRCHYLTAVRALDKEFSTIRIHMMSQQVHRWGIFSHVHPNNWMAVGFSNDTRMGRDLVFICQFYGEDDPVVIATYNSNQQPSMEPIDRHIVEVRPVITYVDSMNEVVGCVFDVPTENISHPAFFYAPMSASPLHMETWPTLHFALAYHEYYVLMAQGTSVYHSDRVSKHIYSAVADQRFSRDIYTKMVTNGSGKLLCNPLIVCCILMIATLL